MKKKGFTLIELLAVIVILAIIAIIATPMILNVINKAKLGAAKSSALGYLDAIEKQIAVNQVERKNEISDGVYEISELTSKGVKVKGTTPSDGWVEIEKKIVKNYSIVVNGYVITKGEEVKKGDTATDKPSGETVNGPTKEEATETAAHKGIVYLDPTDLSKSCTKELAESNLNEDGKPTGVKTGCMKWYIYSEDDSNYTMILNHNVTAAIAWNDNNNSATYKQSNLYPIMEELKTTNGWKVEPRLITATEIANITGNTSFDKNTTGSGGAWTFDNKYGWLTDCSSYCTNYGCTTEDNSTNGYWTDTEAVTNGIWSIYRNGASVITWNGMSIMGSYSIGVRPVITISKSLVSE